MLDSIVLSQFPRHIRERQETLTRFVQAYYAWLGDQKIDPLNVRDIDDTIDQFVNSILTEIATEFPKEVAVDKRLLAKTIHSFYTAKGSSESVRLLFRILFDLDATTQQPGRRVLRASNGVWIDQKKILLKHLQGPTEDLQDILLYKDSLNFVSVRQPTLVAGVDGSLWSFESILEAGSGTLEVGDIIQTNTGSTQETVFEVQRQIDDLKIIQRGTGYSPGDGITVITEVGTALARVTRVSAGVFKGVRHYQYIPNGSRVIITFDEAHWLTVGTPVRVKFVNQAPVDSGVYVIETVDSPFSFSFTSPIALTYESAGPVEISDVSDAGGILQVRWVQKSYNTVSETINLSIETFNGTGAELEVTTGVLSSDFQGYRDERGFLSERYNVLHDGKVFQAYSYIIRVSESIAFWRDIVKQLVHPAGMYLLGEYLAINNVQVNLGGMKKVVHITTRQKVNMTASGIVKTTISPATDIASNTRSAKRLLDAAGTVLPSLSARVMYDTDALFAGITNVNYTGTANEGYWYDFMGTEYAPLFDDIRASSTSYTGVVILKPALTRLSEYFSVEVLPVTHALYFLLSQPIVLGGWEIAATNSSTLSETERITAKLKTPHGSDVYAAEAYGVNATSQGLLSQHIKTYNTHECLVKIHTAVKGLYEFEKVPVFGTTTTGECAFGDG